MPRITFAAACGATYDVTAAPGASLMEAARDNGVPGILADCGGSCACGTCRIHLDKDWWDRLGAPGGIEEATLDAHDDPEPYKRLACQIAATVAMQGMVIRLPASQF